MNTIPIQVAGATVTAQVIKTTALRPMTVPSDKFVPTGVCGPGLGAEEVSLMGDLAELLAECRTIGAVREWQVRLKNTKGLSLEERQELDLLGLAQIAAIEECRAPIFLRDRTMVVRQPHKLLVRGSIPRPAISLVEHNRFPNGRW